MSCRFVRLCLVLLLCASFAQAQTLAHPGWRGNGIASEAWWKHAAFVRFDADTTFTQAAAAMDAISEAGADSLILPDPLPNGTAQPDAEGVSRPFDAKFGTEDDLDALLREASARRMHVLFSVSVSRLAGNPDEVRFWINRGIAGFDAGTVTAVDAGSLRLLRNSLSRSSGQKILLAQQSGWFPEASMFAALPASATTFLEGGKSLYIGTPPTGLSVALYFSDHAARHGANFEVPVFESTYIGTTEQRTAVRQWLALRLGRSRGPRDGAAKSLDPHVQGSAHRRHRR